ncbi:MAG TPA: HEAT repeat domain-containing protein [Bacteroidota bacterium]|nr:HEAT repeat domain-containing protein [Bacteroidota bacterium]
MDEIKQHLATLLSDSDPAARRRAAEGLATCTGFAPVAALAAALRDENKGVRDAALRSLSQIGNKNVARAVVEYLGDTNITTRNLAAELLMRLRDQSLEALLPSLYDANQDVRKFVVDILGVNGSTDAVPHLIKLFADPDENVVISAVEALGNIRSESAIPALTAAFNDIAYARATTAEAIGKIGGTKATEFLLSQINTLIADPTSDPLVLYALLEAIGQIGYDKAFFELSNHISRVKGKLRRILLHAIIRIGERCTLTMENVEVVKQDLIEALKDKNAAIQVSAVKGLANVEGEDVTTALLEAVNRSEECDAVLCPILEYREGAFQVMVNDLESGKITPTKEVIGLMGRLVSRIEYAAIPKELIESDGRLLQRAFDAVKGAWNEATEDLRAVIVDTLFRLDGDQAIQVLDAIVDEPDPWLRIHVIELLAPLTDRRIPEFIGRFMNDEDEMVRDVAASTLAGRGESFNMLTSV